MQATTKVLATIKLDGQKGRGELYLHEGDIWCRMPDGSEQCTETVSGCTTEQEAIDVIASAWALDCWELEWVD